MVWLLACIDAEEARMSWLREVLVQDNQVWMVSLTLDDGTTEAEIPGGTILMPGEILVLGCSDQTARRWRASGRGGLQQGKLL